MEAGWRTARRQDDALWERFHAAQQVFFKARQEKDAKENAELTANLKVKEELAAQAEALLPIRTSRPLSALCVRSRTAGRR